jgi:ADP-ribose pyrophosphatase
MIPEHAECVFTGEIFAVYQWQQQLFDGSYDTFEMLRRPDTTSVMGVVDGQLIVLDEEQPNSGKRRSFPGGRVDQTDADIIAAAQREVLEETGYTFAHWRLVHVWQPIKKMEWFVYYVLAWDVTGQQSTHHDPGEKITVELLDFAEVKRLAEQRVGFLHEVAELFEGVASTEDLLGLAEFSGKTVDT